MKQDGAQSVLGRLLRSAQEVAREPVTSARALRLAMARSAERSVGLTLTVIGVTEEVMPLDVLLAQVDPSWMLISVGGGDRLVGFAGLDLQTRTAVVEVQTLGELRTKPAPERPVTASDAALCAPFVARFLSDFSVTADGTPLSGWTDDLAAGARFADARAVGMVLPDCEMRLVRLSLDLATGDRQGQLILALPVRRAAPQHERSGPGPTFTDQLRSNVMDAPAALLAVLHRMRLPLRSIDAFEIGQTIPLPGVTVRSITVEGSDGTPVAEGRLGQITGMRAVRIEARGAAEIAEMRMKAAVRPLKEPDRKQPAPQMPRDAGSAFAAEMDKSGPDPEIPGPAPSGPVSPDLAKRTSARIDTDSGTQQVPSGHGITEHGTDDPEIRSGASIPVDSDSIN